MTTVETAVPMPIRDILGQIEMRMTSHDWTTMCSAGYEITSIPSALLLELINLLENPHDPRWAQMGIQPVQEWPK
jgi:hypothetical protein